MRTLHTLQVDLGREQLGPLLLEEIACIGKGRTELPGAGVVQVVDVGRRQVLGHGQSIVSSVRFYGYLHDVRLVHLPDVDRNLACRNVRPVERVQLHLVILQELNLGRDVVALIRSENRQNGVLAVDLLDHDALLLD